MMISKKDTHTVKDAITDDLYKGRENDAAEGAHKAKSEKIPGQDSSKKHGTHKTSLSKVIHSPYLFDTLLAVALTLFAWLQALTSRAFFTVAPEVFSRDVNVPIGFGDHASIWTYTLLALCFLPLALRRKYPLPVLGLTVIGQVAVSFLTRDPILSLFGPLIALYTVALLIDRKKLIVTTVMTVVLVVGANAVSSAIPGLNKGEGAGALIGSTAITNNNGLSIDNSSGGSDDPGAFNEFGRTGGDLPPFFFDNEATGNLGSLPKFILDAFVISRGTSMTQALEMLAMLVASAAFGSSIRSSREHAQQVQRNAEEAAKAQQEMERRRLEEERLRIARELHDITAHSLSAVTVQAGAAEAIVKNDPERAAQAIEQIRLTSKESLEELRSFVGVLRSGDTTEDVPLVPEAGIAQINELIEPLKASGIDVKLDISGIDDIPTFASFAAYRIVQEACTNVLRHAEGVHTVEIDIHKVHNETLEITFTDDGKAEKQLSAQEIASGGHGITGMHERAVALGGTLKAHPRKRSEGGGFIVKASLPLSKQE